MTETTYTPGPWTTEAAPHRAWIAKVGNNVDDPEIWTERQTPPGQSYEWGDKIADAKLIAAAPEMAEALKRLINYVKFTPHKCGELEMMLSRAALAKAGLELE